MASSNNLFCLITMEKSSANKNQQYAFNQFFAFIQALLFHEFLTSLRLINTFFSRYWSLVQSPFESCNSRNCDETSQADVDLCHKQLIENNDFGRESLCRDEVEMVMRNLALFSSPEGEELPRKMDSGDLSRLFEEKEPSLEEVKEAFDVFDVNKDGFIDAMELQRVLCILGMKEGFELENCVKMIKNSDQNGDGKIDFSEFAKLMETSFC